VILLPTEEEREQMLTVQNLKKSFGRFEAVKGISFEVKKGEVLGFLGPNGAGKSTTMRMITGFIPPTEGTAVICGHDITEDPVGAKACIGYLPENAPSYRTMTVTDFLTFIAKVRGFTGAQVKERVDAAIEKARLTNVRHQIIETLSKGYRQRTCFAQAILHDPQVLIMDEPTDGLDPNQKFVVRQMIKEMAAEKAIIISTHILEEVDAVCTRALIIAHGEIVANGTPDELRAKDPSHKLDVVFRNLTMEPEQAKN
jgi:ABC-2 type transport system ATP-binding protein